MSLNISMHTMGTRAIANGYTMMNQAADNISKYSNPSSKDLPIDGRNEVDDIVQLHEGKLSVEAGVSVIKAQDRAFKSLIDIEV